MNISCGLVLCYILNTKRLPDPLQAALHLAIRALRFAVQPPPPQPHAATEAEPHLTAPIQPLNPISQASTLPRRREAQAPRNNSLLGDRHLVEQRSASALIQRPNRNPAGFAPLHCRLCFKRLLPPRATPPGWPPAASAPVTDLNGFA